MTVTDQPTPHPTGQPGSRPDDLRGRAAPAQDDVSFRLSDRYLMDAGQVYITGLQALVRVIFDQHRLDRRAGLDTGTLVSGYEGSPLAGLDLEIIRRKDLLDQRGVVFLPAVNEELGVNAVQGSQLSSNLPGRRHDGVVGVWYGKAPGLDRAADAFRHANLGGSSAQGGVLAIVGDDATAKSSTVPSSSEPMVAELGMTCLVPADPQEVIELGLHGIAMSRFCGLWTGLKVATTVADSGQLVRLRAPQIDPVVPDNTIDGRPFVHQASGNLLQPDAGELEKTGFGARPELALRYIRANGLNRIEGDPEARLGMVCAGVNYLNVRQALRMMGIPDQGLSSSGVRILKLGAVAPFDTQAIRDFAKGLSQVVVVEEKRPFVETAVRDALYRMEEAPSVLGKTGEDGSVLLRNYSDLPPDLIAGAVAPLVAEATGDERVSAWVTGGRGVVSKPRKTIPLEAERIPYFCSGCPHNRSTRNPEGTLVGGGIGCHTMITYMQPEQVGQLVSLCQMGGEGAVWAGVAPFVREPHLVQNLGDGTFHHSGSLAIRFAIASGANITYKLLYNGAVAMTGGQRAVGKMSIPSICRELQAEGVAKIAITSDEPARWRGSDLPAGIGVFDRRDFQQVQADLAKIEGVTILIHDQECATELRRKRKRGTAPRPTTAIFINERVCEGCGDCGAKSNCLSLEPVDTPFGRKTRINQTSCNTDLSCLEGDCPAFVRVDLAARPGDQDAARSVSARRRIPVSLGLTKASLGAGRASQGVARAAGPDQPTGNPGPDAGEVLDGDLPQPPEFARTGEFTVRITGIGGTGIVTMGQVLAVAGAYSGWSVRSLDQYGMAQKGGAVISDVILTAGPSARDSKVAPGECDLYLVPDLLVGCQESSLMAASSSRTRTVVSTSKSPTGRMVSDVRVDFPDLDPLLAALAERSTTTTTFDAREVSDRLFGTKLYANTYMLGVAVQSGALPIHPEHLEAALVENGTATQANIQAFRWGRLHAVDPSRLAPGVADRIRSSLADPALLAPWAAGDADGAPARDADGTPARDADGTPPRDADGTPVAARLGAESKSHGASLAERIAELSAELVRYQDRALAKTFSHRVARVETEVAKRAPEQEAIVAAFAKYQHKLMAYKDEYEVARLCLLPEVDSELKETFGEDTTYAFMLHPPMLRAMGLDRKIGLGPGSRPALERLARMKRLRGTKLDPFGRAEVRKVEQQLPGEYWESVERAVQVLTSANAATVLALVELPDLVRGYENLKLENVKLYRQRLSQLRQELGI